MSRKNPSAKCSVPSSSASPGSAASRGGSPGAYPAGAAELLVALQTPMGNRLGLPALVWGKPGQGKTSFLESLSSPTFPVHQVIASIHDPTDFGGMPFCDADRVRMLPPEWAVDLAEAGRGILLLDDITTAAPAIQAALLRVVLERRVGCLQLPPEVRIIAAANPPEDLLGGWELSAPLANRFLHIEWDLPAATFADALRHGFAPAELPEIDRELHSLAAANWSGILATFLSVQPSLVNTTAAEGEQAYASPRTWLDLVVNLMASCELLGQAPRAGDATCTPLCSRLLVGSVGSGPATAFLGFLKNLQFPDPDDILDGHAKLDLAKLRDDELHTFFSALANRVLARHRQGEASALDATLVTLDLAEQVGRQGRVDVVFPPLRRLASERAFQQCLSLAEAQQKTQELHQRIAAVFLDEDLVFLTQMVIQSGDKSGAKARK